ncbi:hypothetical protein K438DRAFT_1687140 [Mycena galopus ATCC 62051]|nr:hypothetical protein K438DRAFT_1687140 [Mycena galopus ATCC 62051]
MSTRLYAIRVTAALVFFVALLNLYLLVASTKKDRSAQYHNYSYVGDDYPELWEIPSAQNVAMLMEETRSYPMDGGANAREIWATTTSKGFGYVRLGAEHRAFAVSMFHQLHCMRLIHAALAGQYDEASHWHMQHCLNYIRQMILCSPNLTLEPADILSRDYEADRTGATHVCEDWSAMYRGAEKNWDTWFQQTNSSAPIDIVGSRN